MPPIAGVVSATVGATMSILTVPVLAEPGAAPVLPAPSVALQTMACVPFPLTLRVPCALDVPRPDRPPTAIDAPPSVQATEATFDTSAAVTDTSTGAVMKYPAWPFGA